MKKRLTALILVVCLAVCFALTACGKNEEAEQDLGEQYSYSFETNGGTAVTGGTLYVNEYIPVPAPTTRDGYVFLGWYADSACTQLVEFVHPSVRMPAHDVVYYAGWEQLVSITFETNGGSAVNKIEGFAYDVIPDSVINSVKTEKADSIFDGWYYDALFTEPFTLSYIPTVSITVYAKWHNVNNSVAVTFVNGAETVAEYADLTEGELLADTVDFDDLAQEDTEIRRFIGWALDEEGYYLIDDTFTVPAGDVTLYAIYRQNANIAHFTVAETKYTKAVDVYITKYITVKGVGVSDIIKQDALAADGLKYDYFVDAYGEIFDLENDIITGNLELHPVVYSVGLQIDYTVDANGNPSYATVTGYTGSSETVVIPESYYVSDGEAEGMCAIEEIAENAFKGKSLRGIVMPDSIAVIGESAFENCVNLSEVTFPKNLLEVHNSAFKGCTELSDVTFNDSVYYFGYRVFEGTAFEEELFEEYDGYLIYISFLNPNITYDTLYYCNGTFSSLSPITLQYGLSIAGGAFEGMKNLGRVNVTGNIAIIGDRAFKDCTDLLIVVFDTYVERIEASAFEGCTSLVTFDTYSYNMYLSYIGERAFYGCSSLTGFFFGPYLATLGEYAFYGCTSLEIVEMFITVINNSYYMCPLTEIPAYAFYGCTSLTEITTMAFVTSVGESAFEGCTALETVILGFSTGSRLASIGANAFKDCTSLEKVYICKGATTVSACPVIDETAFSGAGDFTIYVFSRYLEVYQSAYDNNYKLSDIESDEEQDADSDNDSDNGSDTEPDTEPQA